MICPRCGGEEFRKPANYAETAELLKPSARRVDVSFTLQSAAIDICANPDCGLFFAALNGGWREPNGEEFVMAESGT